MDLIKVGGFAVAVLGAFGAVMQVVKYGEFGIARRLFDFSGIILAVVTLLWTATDSAVPTIGRGAICGLSLLLIVIGRYVCRTWTDGKQDHDETPNIFTAILAAAFMAPAHTTRRIAFEVHVRNEGAPSTLRTWLLLVSVEGRSPVFAERVSLRKTGGLLIDAVTAHGMRSVGLEADDDLAEKVGNTEVIRHGEVRGVLAWNIPNLSWEELIGAGARFTLSAADCTGRRISLPMLVADAMKREWID